MKKLLTKVFWVVCTGIFITGFLAGCGSAPDIKAEEKNIEGIVATDTPIPTAKDTVDVKTPENTKTPENSVKAEATPVPTVTEAPKELTPEQYEERFLASLKVYDRSPEWDKHLNECGVVQVDNMLFYPGMTWDEFWETMATSDIEYNYDMPPTETIKNGSTKMVIFYRRGAKNYSWFAAVFANADPDKKSHSIKEMPLVGISLSAGLSGGHSAVDYCRFLNGYSIEEILNSGATYANRGELFYSLFGNTFSESKGYSGTVTTQDGKKNAMIIPFGKGYENDHTANTVLNEKWDYYFSGRKIEIAFDLGTGDIISINTQKYLSESDVNVNFVSNPYDYEKQPDYYSAKELYQQTLEASANNKTGYAVGTINAPIKLYCAMDKSDLRYGTTGKSYLIVEIQQLGETKYAIGEFTPYIRSSGSIGFTQEIRFFKDEIYATLEEAEEFVVNKRVKQKAFVVIDNFE